MTRITLLDGGMGQELVARSGDEPTPLWATRVMIHHPELVRAIHDDYFAAGATVATTNTYAIHHDRWSASASTTASRSCTGRRSPQHEPRATPTARAGLQGPLGRWSRLIGTMWSCPSRRPRPR